MKTEQTTVKRWLLFAIITTISWGVWGAFIEIPEKSGFPATLGYVAWSITMIPCALVALYIIDWKLEHNMRSALLGLSVGILGAGGQLLLFQALRSGPAYLVFPLISLFPMVTIVLSFTLLKESGGKRHWIGIALALVAIFFLSYMPSKNESTFAGVSWIFLAVIVFFMWGVQAFIMKFANASMKAESIFFYMMIASVLLVPIALYMTDFSQPVYMGFAGPYLALMVHLLNSVGALTLVYALRDGKAIVVVPLTGLSPIITVGISLILYAVVPTPMVSVGVVFALIAMYLLSD